MSPPYTPEQLLNQDHNTMSIPSNISEAARLRVQQTRSDRLAALRANSIGHPLDAEPDEARKIRRLKAVLPVGTQQAEALANYRNLGDAVAMPRSLCGPERIQGSIIDFLAVSFLELAVAAASSVARVIFSGRRPRGSAFMVSDRLLLSNNHVIASPSQAREFLVEFDYQLDHRGEPKEATHFALAPDVFFLTSPEAC